MLKKTSVLAALIMGLGQSAFAVTVTSGTVTMTGSKAPFRGALLSQRIDCTSDDNEDVVATITRIQGTIERVILNPDGGAEAPTNNYDITLTDQDGIDILGGWGANRSSVTTQQDIPTIDDGAGYFRMPTVGPLTLAMSNMGAANGTVLCVIFRR